MILMTEPQYEHCSICDDLTGRAGRADDSLYAERLDGTGEVGPLCYECFQQLVEAGVIDDDR